MTLDQASVMTVHSDDLRALLLAIVRRLDDIDARLPRVDYTDEQVARILRVSERRVRALRAEGKLPPARRQGRRPLTSIDTINDYLRTTRYDELLG
jgi:hypothetical protein